MVSTPQRPDSGTRNVPGPEPSEPGPEPSEPGPEPSEPGPEPSERWVPDRSLPPYRHRLGQTPHPRTHPQGHGYGAAEPVSGPLTHENWRQHEAWLFGVDLFNHRYWWEAHECWEAAWRVSPDAVTGHFLKGLIQSAAALLKWEQGNDRGRFRLWRRAGEHLRCVDERMPVFMGLDVASFVAQMTSLWGPAAGEIPKLHLRDIDK